MTALYFEPPILAEWRAGCAKLKKMPTHRSFPPNRWRVLVKDAENFCTCWGRRAAELGWTTLDLFAVHATSPYRRMDGIGLVAVITGFHVAEMNRDTATIVVPSAC